MKSGRKYSIVNKLCLILLFIVVACKSSVKESLLKSNLTNGSTFINNSSNQIDFNIIVNNSANTLSSVKLIDIFPDLDKLKIIDSITATKICSIEVNETKNWFIYNNFKYEPLYYFQHEIIEDVKVFSFLQKDEVCCMSLFYCFLNNENEIVSINFIGLLGADGGWSEEDEINRTKPLEINVVKNEEIDEDVFEDGIDYGYTRKTIKTKVRINLTSSGIIRDTLDVKIDTVLIEPIK